MTKKSLMIASAVILPLTVGVMAMGIGAGNKFNDHLVAGTDAVSGTITFTGTAVSIGDNKYSTEAVTSLGNKIYLINHTNLAPTSGQIATFPNGFNAGSITTKMMFSWDQSGTNLVKFQKIKSISITVSNNNVTRAWDIYFSSDNSSYSKHNQQLGFESSNTGSLSLSKTESYMYLIYGGDTNPSFNTFITNFSIGYDCVPA